MPPITAAPTSPAASPGPQPPPRHRASAGDVAVRAVMPMVTAVVKANTVLFMSLTLSGFSEPLTGELRKRFQSGRSAARSWHGPCPLTESHLLQTRPPSARRRIRRDGKPCAATAVSSHGQVQCRVLSDCVSRSVRCHCLCNCLRGVGRPPTSGLLADGSAGALRVRG